MHIKSSNEGGENTLQALCELGRNGARENGEGAKDGERAVEYEGKDYGSSYEIEWEGKQDSRCQRNI